MAEPRNVVLICLDSVRKDYFDEYARRLRELSDVSFAQCRAASSCSVPSHASMMTGELPHRHGINSYNVAYDRLEPADTFLDDIQSHRSIGISANAFAGSPFGFDGIFDEFADVSWTRRFPEGMDAEEFAARTDAEEVEFYVEFLREALGHDHPIKTAANAALAQLDISVLSRLPVPMLLDDGAKGILAESRRRIDDGPEPFFLFLNLMEAHVPHHNTFGYDDSLHDVPDGWSSIRTVDEWRVILDGVEPYREDVERFRELYGVAIDYLDRTVAGFVRDLRELTDRETSVVVTADHGENLGFRADDEGLFGHMSSLSEGLLHVPLTVVDPPDGYPTREREYVSHLRLGELIGGLAAGETPDVTDYRIAAERIGTSISGVEMDDAERRHYERMLRCAYDGETKFVWDSLDGRFKYDLDHARPCWQERSEADVRLPEWAQNQFDEPIEEYARDDVAVGSYDDVDQFTRERLEDLGYL